MEATRFSAPTIHPFGSGRRTNRMSELAIRSRQAIVIAQRAAGVILAEKPALAQDRYDIIGKHIESAGQPRWHHVEAVGSAILKPVLDIIGDLLRRPCDNPVSSPARKTLHQLTNGRFLRSTISSTSSASHAASGAPMEVNLLPASLIYGPTPMVWSSPPELVQRAAARKEQFIHRRWRFQSD